MSASLKLIALLISLVLIESCQVARRAHLRRQAITHELNIVNFSNCVEYFYPDTISMGMVCFICMKHQFNDQIEDAGKNMGLFPSNYAQEFLNTGSISNNSNLLSVSKECLNMFESPQFKKYKKQYIRRTPWRKNQTFLNGLKHLFSKKDTKK